MPPPPRAAGRARIVAGIAGARRNATAALCLDGQVRIACEQERLTRSRNVGIERGSLPADALDALLGAIGSTRDDLAAYAVAEPGIVPPDTVACHLRPHHAAHAELAFRTSPFDEAAVLVCDHHGAPEVSVWSGARGMGLRPCDWRWEGAGFARIYSRVAAALGLAPEGEEHKVEGQARTGTAAFLAEARRLIARHGQGLVVAPRFEETIAGWLGEARGDSRARRTAEVACSLQQRIGELLLEAIAEVRRLVHSDHLCVAGGLFYNTWINTIVAQSDLFRRVFVPVNPGNAGLALGAALSVDDPAMTAPGVTDEFPFLGPGYDSAEIKATLENCKIAYEYATRGTVIERTVEALARGYLVGWFQGRMEWGPRALGNRSILASPRMPYVLENLNAFLKQGEPYRAYGVSVPEEDLDRYFHGPMASPFMQYEYTPKDPQLFESLLPAGSTRLRVHTVGRAPMRFRALLEAFGRATGLPVLVNTSFNGFREPMVCTPRDAVRVFYGTGLDVLVLDEFTIRK